MHYLTLFLVAEALWWSKNSRPGGVPQAGNGGKDVTPVFGFTTWYLPGGEAGFSAAAEAEVMVFFGGAVVEEGGSSNVNNGDGVGGAGNSGGGGGGANPVTSGDSGGSGIVA